LPKLASPKLSPSVQLTIIAVFCLTGATSAHAAMSLGSILCNGVENSRPFAPVFTWISYLAGVIAAIAGVYHLRLHAESPQNQRLTTPLMELAGSMTLMSLPAVMNVLVTSIYGKPEGSASLNCAAGPVMGGPGLDQMLRGFVSNIEEPLKMASSAAALLSGLYMIVRGLMKASKYGTDPKTHNMHSVLTYLGFGALLVSIGQNLDVMLATLFGTSTVADSSIIKWGKLDAIVGGGGISQRFKDAVNAALVFVQLIGCIAFVRGWLLMKKVVEGAGNANLAQAMTHILGGVAAINIYQFLVAMDYTFGTNLIS